MQILEERNEILAQEQNFSQGMRQVVWGRKVVAVNIYWIPRTPLQDVRELCDLACAWKLIISFVAAPQMCQVPFYFRTFALAQFHLWDAVPPDIHMAPALSLQLHAPMSLPQWGLSWLRRLKLYPFP